MNLKTTTQLVVEAARIIENNVAELLGIQPLHEAYSPFSFAIKNGVITDNNTFTKVFSEDDHFFYSLQQVRKDKVVKSERGIGHIKKNKKQVLLIRDIPISSISEDNKANLCIGGCEYFECVDCDHIVAQVSAPATYAECLYEDNILISSQSPFMPSMVKVAPNTLVGRLDSDTVSITFEQLCSNKQFQNELISLLKKYNKQLVLESPKVNIKKIQTNCVQFDKDSDINAKKNSLVLKDGTLQFFDGNDWYKINMEMTT
jgi:hypothetical protein